MTPLSGALPKGYIGKPEKGTRKSEQQERARERCEARRFERWTVPQTRRAPIRREGNVAKRQKEWNKSKMTEWKKRYGDKFKCAVTGTPYAQITDTTHMMTCGHIIPVGSEPRLRENDDNVAPIIWAVNEKMNPSHPEYTKDFELFAVQRMRAWVEKDKALREKERLALARPVD